MFIVDCTLRDGGYYNSWDFPKELINKYLQAMHAADIKIVEIGFRTLINNEFNGACLFSTDEFLNSLLIPNDVLIGVMVNASEILRHDQINKALNRLFPNKSSDSPVKLVRIACHVFEFEKTLPAATWLKNKGYIVGFNIMQIADRTNKEIQSLAKLANEYPIDVLYFADSMGSMTPEKTEEIILSFRKEWKGSLGIHTHDNQGLAMSNTLRAIKSGVTWIDSTLTGMGRGPGNVKTEELLIETSIMQDKTINLVPVLALIREKFKPMRDKYQWGSNPFYYLGGKYGIHPTYIQEMLSDNRYKEEDILAVIEHLKVEGGKRYNSTDLDSARKNYTISPTGKWSPKSICRDKTILLLGTGPGVKKHRHALELYIKKHKPLVLALNTQCSVDPEMINLRVACHPLRLLADCDLHTQLPQPLITPFSMLPLNVKDALKNKEILDFGLKVQSETFEFKDKYCIVPSELVIAYALAILASGGAKSIYLAGFDGYEVDDPRNIEMNNILENFKSASENTQLIAVTPTRYEIMKKSIYGMLE